MKKRLSKYDFIIVASQEAKKLFKRFVKNKRTKILVQRYMKLDYFLKKTKFKKYKHLKNVLIAPTNFKSFPNLTMQNFLSDIIQNFLDKNFTVNYRPHPSNLNDKQTINLQKKFKEFKNFYLDKSSNYLNSFNKSDLMITDLSGIAYTYLILTSKPIIFYSTNERYLKKTYYAKLGYFSNRDKIGHKIYNKYSLFKLINSNKIISQKKTNIKKFREKFLKQEKINFEFF